MPINAKIERVDVFYLDMKLKRPYSVSSATFYGFEPMVAVVRDSDGNVGMSEAVITEGYCQETNDGGWALLASAADSLVGQSASSALQGMQRFIALQPTASTVICAALEMLQNNSLLIADRMREIPLLEPIHSQDLDEITDEVEETLGKGFRTLKIKVGFDVAQDLRRVAKIQEVNAGRAKLRLDANCGYSSEDGCAFASSLQPNDIELFEQPCGSSDWASNTDVSLVSTVPVMLDESIYGISEIDRASKIDNIQFIKLKMKKMGGMAHLIEGIKRIKKGGMSPVLGDGTATEIGCWQEACVAENYISNAGEMNGFIKYTESLFKEPLKFDNGSIWLEPNWQPDLDFKALERNAIRMKTSRLEVKSVK